MKPAPDEIRETDGLQVDEDALFQKRSWRVQSVGRGMIALFVLAGLAGFFGGAGPAAHGTHSRPVQIRYPRFVRMHAPVQFLITVPPDAGGAGTVSVAINKEFFDSFEVEQIVPQPRAERLGQGAIIYEFDRVDRADASISFRVKAAKRGATTATFTVGSAEPAKMKSFVFP